jgi:agmatine/peptidylarginine deiminase
MWCRGVARLCGIAFIIIMLVSSGAFLGMAAMPFSGGTGDESGEFALSAANSAPWEPNARIAPTPHYAAPVTGGWNLISFPVVAYGSPDKVLDDAGGDTAWNVVKWYDPLDAADPWKTYRIGGTANDLEHIDATMGLWIFITDPGSDGELVVEGEAIGTVQISLRTGWNLVGYPSLAPASAALSLPAGADMVSYYQPNPPYITDTADLSGVTLEPGNGYWVHSSSDIVWNIENPEPIRQTAEFERMQGVLIRYPLGIPYSLIAEMSEDAVVYTLLRNSYLTQAQNNYASNGVNMANCEWIITTTDSYWTRDYGPWWITDENGEFGIVDFPYNRPRANDNLVPGVVASYLGVPLDYMNVYHTGGNYMTDGRGISISTDLVIEENGYDEAMVRQLHKDYLNIGTYHIVPDVNGEYIKHIDCWSKYLDVDKIMIRSVPTGHAQYDEIEAAVDYFEAQTSAYGTPYQIFRVYTPNDEPYSNCLILNDKVLLPIVGGANDAAAIASYQAAMPGYEIIGFTGSWESTDALHCRTRGIPDQGMLYIQHTPVTGTQAAGEPIEIRARIMAYSGSDLTGHALYWKLSAEPGYHEVPMSHVISGHYNAFIPGQAPGATVQYYIGASDDSGRGETSPLIGVSDPNVFVVG